MYNSVQSGDDFRVRRWQTFCQHFIPMSHHLTTFTRVYVLRKVKTEKLFANELQASEYTHPLIKHPTNVSKRSNIL